MTCSRLAQRTLRCVQQRSACHALPKWRPLGATGGLGIPDRGHQKTAELGETTSESSSRLPDVWHWWVESRHIIFDLLDSVHESLLKLLLGIDDRYLFFQILQIGLDRRLGRVNRSNYCDDRYKGGQSG